MSRLDLYPDVPAVPAGVIDDGLEYGVFLTENAILGPDLTAGFSSATGVIRFIIGASMIISRKNEL